jgi:hypothetical protein
MFTQAEVAMVQRYPSSGKSVEPERLPAPPPVMNAVKLMYVGAAVSTVSLVVTLADVGGLKAAIKKAKPSWTAAQINQGKNWARILSTVLFCLATLDLFGVFSAPKTAIGLVFPVLTWLVGLGAVFLLWRPESTAFFKSQGLL